MSGIVGILRSDNKAKHQTMSRLDKRLRISRNEQELRDFSGWPHGWDQNSQHLIGILRD